MKKLLTLALAIVLAFTFVACGDPASDGGEKTVAVMYYDFADPYISTVRESLDQQLGAAGIKFNNFDSANNQATQIDQVTNALANGDDLLVINLVDSESDAAKTIIDAAAAQSVPVVFFNRSISDALLSEDNVIFVGTDAPEAGHLQGKMIGDYLVENFDSVDLNGDGVITYAMLKGQEGNAEADARTKYSVEDANAILTAAGKAELKYYLDGATAGVDGQYYEVDSAGDWCAAHANDIITNAMQNSDDMIELIIANNDNMAEGAIAALQAAGYNSPDSDVTIPVFGVDATDRAKELIGQGAMVGTVKQDNVGMATALTIAIQNGLAGKALNEGIVGTHGDITFNSAPGIDNKIYVPYAPYQG